MKKCLGLLVMLIRRSYKSKVMIIRGQILGNNCDALPLTADALTMSFEQFFPRQNLLQIVVCKQVDKTRRKKLE